jgi:putative endonuclease
MEPMLRQFRNYCGLTKIERCGFPWKKTTGRPVASPDFLRAALTEDNDVRLSSRKAACSSMAPPSSTGNPGSVYTNCKTALALRLLEGFVHASDSLAVRLRRRSSRPAHLEVGRRGEEAAFFYLRRRGYIVVARGWRSAKVRGDLDLVAWENTTLCIIEVKTRTSRNFATAEAAVDHDKIRRTARQYLHALPIVPDQVRFDVLSIYYDAQESFELIRGAFDWR